MQQHQLHPEANGGLLHFLGLDFCRRIVRVDEGADNGSLRPHLVQEFEPLGLQRGTDHADAGNVGLGPIRLATRPVLTGSAAVMNTIGMVEGAALAARPGSLPPAAMIKATWRFTSSAARAGNRSYRPSAQRYSIGTFWPSTYPASFRPCRVAAVRVFWSAGDPLPRNPPTGIADGCARTASGDETARPPTRAINSRRFIRSPRRRGRAACLAH